MNHLGQPTWPPSPPGGPAGDPAHQGHPCLLLPLPEGSRRVTTAWRHAHCHLLPACRCWSRPRAPRSPLNPLALDPSSSSALPSSHHRTHLRAPLAVAMTTGHPSSRGCAQQLRNRAPHPQAEGNEPEGFASSPSPSSSTSDLPAITVKFVGSGPSPTSPSVPSSSL